MKKGFRHAPDRMISGKLRSKAARTRATQTKVTVDGQEYAWRYRHGWLVWGRGIKVISISVALDPGRTRELILDFTLTMDAQDAAPSDVRGLRALESGIRAARAAGWDPESRGRAFRYEIAESI